LSANATDQTPPVRLHAADYKALGAFRRAIREFLAFSEEGASEVGLTSQQHQALLAIHSHDGPNALSIGELAQSLLIRNHSAVGLVSRLVERGLVTRHASVADRRRILLSLQPAGAELLEKISVRNLRQLHQAAEILAGIVATVGSLERGEL
jgi:DNA-binding MarR family transcriptional regulator